MTISRIGKRLLVEVGMMRIAIGVVVVVAKRKRADHVSAGMMPGIILGMMPDMISGVMPCIMISMKQTGSDYKHRDLVFVFSDFSLC